mgnify:CR=1 FL=1
MMRTLFSGFFKILFFKNFGERKSNVLSQNIVRVLKVASCETPFSKALDAVFRGLSLFRTRWMIFFLSVNAKQCEKSALKIRCLIDINWTCLKTLILLLVIVEIPYPKKYEKIMNGFLKNGVVDHVEEGLF